VLLVGPLALVLLSVGWGTFVRLAERGRADPSRELAEEIARAIQHDEIVVALFPTPPMEAIRGGVQILSARKFRMSEVNRRLLSAETVQQLELLSPAGNAKYLRFAIRTGGTQPTVCSIADVAHEFSKYALEHPDWESRRVGGEDPRVPVQYFWFRAPVEDLDQALALARTCF
jgi:hypothetical protein